MKSKKIPNQLRIVITSSSSFLPETERMKRWKKIRIWIVRNEVWGAVNIDSSSNFEALTQEIEDYINRLNFPAIVSCICI